MSGTLIHQRDLSWLSFNERVLQEAEDQSNPLYERLKFLAIFSANLDEFYKVRMSDLRKFKHLKKELRPKEVEKPNAIVKEILNLINTQQERYGKILWQHIVPDLHAVEIHLINHNEFSAEQSSFSEHYFNNTVKPLISVYDLENNPPFLKDKGLYLVFKMAKSIKLVNIPSDQLPRFVSLPSAANSYSYCFLDDIIRDNMDAFLEMKSRKNRSYYAIKLTRDAELYLDEDDYSEEIITQIIANLPNRAEGLPTRLLYDMRIEKELLKKIRHSFQLNKLDLVSGGTYHNLHDFFGFPQPLKTPSLFYTEQPPLKHPNLENQQNLLQHFAQHAEILHYPYQKFNPIIELLKQAAISEKVLSISITLYRLASTSAVAQALLLAREHHKKVTVFIEVKARFDEENNIFWGEKLQAAGAQVVYSKPNLKVHSKVFLIEGIDFKISHIGTGNFNEKNATIYTDFSYITPNKDVAKDIAEVFRFLKEEITTPQIKKIWLSPFYFRSNLEAAIQNEIANHQAGRNAFIRLKLNALQDEKIIDKLYQAALAGVSIQLIVRGICCLKFQQKGMESMKGISIVGRYLEHSRIYWFANGGNEQVLIASADAMTRNLDRRIEVGVEIEEPEIKTIVKDCFLMQFKDNQKARILDEFLLNCFQFTKGKSINSQNELYAYFEQQLSETRKAIKQKTTNIDN